MSADLNASRGGHVGAGGIQAWSAGELFPWVLYTVEHYLPRRLCEVAGKELTIEDRFAWAEVRLSHPNGADLLVGEYGRADDMATRKERIRLAQARAERAVRVDGVLRTMARVMHYGQPE